MYNCQSAVFSWRPFQTSSQTATRCPGTTVTHSTAAKNVYQVANSAMQFRRRVAVVLSSTVWDTALTQYVAKNVILPGDRVILVRCLNENVNRKNTEELQVERDYLRELGWHKFKRTNVALAVEVIKSQTRALCDFIEEKGVDLLIMTRSESNKLKRSITKGRPAMLWPFSYGFVLENACFQAFPHRCPCPFMIVPTGILRGVIRRQPTSVGDVDLPSTPFMSSPTFQGFFSKKSWSTALQSPRLRLFSGRRCQSMDMSDTNMGLPNQDASRDDSIELSSSAAPELEKKSPHSWKPPKIQVRTAPIVPEASGTPPSVSEEDLQKQEAVRRLQQLLSEKEKEILDLKQQLVHLQEI